jgi:hypothetical protein
MFMGTSLTLTYDELSASPVKKPISLPINEKPGEKTEKGHRNHALPE